MPFLPKRRLGHPENYIFLLSKNNLQDQSTPKKIWINFEKTCTALQACNTSSTEWNWNLTSYSCSTLQDLSAVLLNYCVGKNLEVGNFDPLGATQECQSVQTCVRKGDNPIVYGIMVCWHSNLTKYKLQTSNDQTMSRTYLALSEAAVIILTFTCIWTTSLTVVSVCYVCSLSWASTHGQTPQSVGTQFKVTKARMARHWGLRGSEVFSK